MSTAVLQSAEDAEAWLASLAYPATVSWVQGVDRSRQQNALMWQWASEVANQRGDVCADEVQAEWKLHHGVPILRAEDDSFRTFYDSAMMGIDYQTKLEIMQRGFPITRDMSKAQMVAFMNRVQAECAQQNWIITDPDPGLAEWMQATTNRKESK